MIRADRTNGTKLVGGEGTAQYSMAGSFTSVSGLSDLFSLKPLDDPRWERFLARHPRSSAYHTVEWLSVLRRTYGYRAIAFTTSPPGTELRNAVVFCDVQTWLTRRRLVSLPFSDHCDVLFDDPADLNAAFAALRAELRKKHFSYIEFRPTVEMDTTTLGPHSLHSYCRHQLDLGADIDALYGNCHRDSTQRKIRRAERECLRYEEGRSPLLLNNFYDLLILTRRRHGVPPQPKRWFQSLIDVFGHKLKIRVAFKGDRPIAAILTLRHTDTLLYKYGCSDERFHNLGGMHLLIWRSIMEAKQAGMRVFDLGRSEWNQDGLIKFKDRWGAERTSVRYIRLLKSMERSSRFVASIPDWKERAAKMVVSRMPGYFLRAAGELIYPHVG